MEQPIAWGRTASDRNPEGTRWLPVLTSEGADAREAGNISAHVRPGMVSGRLFVYKMR